MGQITGVADTADGTSHAFRWTPSGGMQDLGTLGGATSSGYVISALGHVIGVADTADGSRHTFLWTATGGMRDLGEVVPSGLKIRGQVAGVITGVDGVTSRPVRWTAAGGLQDLGTLGGAGSWTWGINDRGQVIGSSDTADGWQRAFRKTPSSGMTDLGSLGGNSIATAINIRGQVAGFSGTPMGESHAFLWTP
ncbi:hypothetical protein ACLQ2Q_15740 [Microbacterium sp. DT81.1]|uniref:hypothetical protein n=1 Tax=Microbacterium sp. DT81.1 TaxID=3393413 RepID=UPI003CFA117A